jgi:hypothetical protein
MSEQAAINAAINAAMGQIQKLAKDDRNQHGNYSFASVDAFLDMCRPICAEHGLHPQVDSISTETFNAGNGKLWAKFSYKMAMSHISGEKTENVGMDIMLPLTGAQTSGSAQSYAVKQFLRGLLMISTGDKDDVDFKPQAPEDGVDAAKSTEENKSKYDLDALETKIQTFKSLTGLNAWIGEMNPVLTAMHKENNADYNRFFAFWKKQEKDLSDGKT